ncbi:MAG TPA: radical SAM family heme chaperone HemW [Cryptosporangiaceae bacterium]|nr:radical SAM family heme chaperone HemW [Cryptosporangiaceae bacterium]
MASSPPDGEPAPADGALPAAALADVGARGFGIYLHVPFCASRCGYCDFNTYTPAELGGTDPAGYVEAVLAELKLAANVLGGVTAGVGSVFVGGGTPTLLPPDDLVRLLDAVDAAFGLATDAEVTTEANPESVDAGSLAALRRGGFTRVSLGMQSARAHVLAALDRRHTPGRAVVAAREAREAGFDHVNLDLIYGAADETDGDWQASLDAVVGAGVDHVSAYALIVEDGTRLGRQVARGEVRPPDDDVLADRYLRADATLTAAGLAWYEVSNWAASPTARCRHNALYWQSGDWWGLGPGAHSHVGGVRWWNVGHPARYSERLASGFSPALAREVLDAGTRRVEEVMLRLRLVEGLPVEVLDPAGEGAARRAAVAGLLDPEALAAGHAVLTVRGRLLADSVVRDLLGFTSAS